MFLLPVGLFILAESWATVAAGALAAAITMSLFDKGGWVSSGVSFGLTIPSERATAARSIIEFVRVIECLLFHPIYPRKTNVNQSQMFRALLTHGGKAMFYSKSEEKTQVA